MRPDEFIERAIGVPWARWRSDWKAMDCFGLIVLWHREVRGIDLGDVPQTDIVSGFNDADGWTECEIAIPHSTAFMSFLDGAPRHCGIVLTGGKLLHSEGGIDRAGSVRVSRLEAIEKVYGAVKYFRYADPTI